MLIIQIKFLNKIIALFCMFLLVGCAQVAPILNNTVASEEKDKLIKFSQTDRGAMITTYDKLLFDSGKIEIKTEGQPFIRLLIDQIKNNDIRLLIEGHTDSIGKESENKILSEKRAAAVKQALILGGIKTERITTVGMGPDKPVDSNETENGRRNNRRTEVILLGEKLENINKDNFMANLSRQFVSLVNNITEQLEYKPTPQNFNPKERIRILGPVTRCSEQTKNNYLIIEGSSLEPNELNEGDQAILTVKIQTCIPQNKRINLTQTINIYNGKKLIISGAKNNFDEMSRNRSNLFTSIHFIGKIFKPGQYNLEYVMRMDGRDFKQTTPFTIK